MTPETEPKPAQPQEEQRTLFDVWLGWVKQAAYDQRGYSKTAVTQFDPASWKDYFDEGLTPMEALDEDEKHA